MFHNAFVCDAIILATVFVCLQYMKIKANKLSIQKICLGGLLHIGVWMTHLQTCLS